MDDSTTEGVVLQFKAPDDERVLVLDDDGRVAYAYMMDGEEIVSDVWLYNVDETPDTVDWRDRSAMPFLNPKRFCREMVGVSRLSSNSRVQCHWHEKGVTVAMDGIVLARLERGAKPGWSRLALLPGPLAKPLTDDTD